MQLAKSVLTLENANYLPITDLTETSHWNPGRLLCNLQLSTLVEGEKIQSEPQPIPLTEDMRKITKSVFSADTPLSRVLSLFDAYPRRLPAFVHTNYLVGLDNSDDMEAGAQISEILSSTDTLPRSYSGTCLSLVLKRTQWTSRHPSTIRIPESTGSSESRKKRALRMSALISGMNYDGVLEVIGHTRDQLRYLGSHSRYLFSRNHGEFPYVHREYSSDLDLTPQKQQLLLLMN